MNNQRLMIHSGLIVALAMLFVSSGVLASEAALIAPSSFMANNQPAESLPDPVEPQAVLWDQTDLPGGDVVNSSNYPLAFDHQIADDFVITDTVNNYWQVTAVKVIGRYSPDTAQATSVNVQFYTDTLTNTKHLPGTLLHNLVVNTPPVSGTATITLPSPVYLAVGTPITYWVSIQANMASGTWLWAERNSTSPYNGTSPSVYKGPDQGNNFCLANWGRRIADCDFPQSSNNVDMRFAIVGQAVLFTDFIFLPLLRR